MCVNVQSLDPHRGSMHVRFCSPPWSPRVALLIHEPSTSRAQG